MSHAVDIGVLIVRVLSLLLSVVVSCECISVARLVCSKDLCFPRLPTDIEISSGLIVCY